jgi:hypothetical protein
MVRRMTVTPILISLGISTIYIYDGIWHSCMRPIPVKNLVPSEDITKSCALTDSYVIAARICMSIDSWLIHTGLEVLLSLYPIASYNTPEVDHHSE